MGDGPFEFLRSGDDIIGDARVGRSQECGGEDEDVHGDFSRMASLKGDPLMPARDVSKPG